MPNTCQLVTDWWDRVSVHFEFATLLYLVSLCFCVHSFCSLHERGKYLYMHAAHQHAYSTPPFQKVWLRAC